MTFTYSGNPASSARDAVRFLSGDTVAASAMTSDEEIAWLLSESNDDAYIAAAGVCEAGASRAATQADESKSVGDLSIATQYGALARTLLDRASGLRVQAARRRPPSPDLYLDGDGNVFGPMMFAVDMDRNNG